jgi:hypothetical protein
MTREELNEHIKELDATIGLGIHTNIVKAWLEDIRDNGITEPKKYRILVMHKGNSHFEIWLFYEGGGVFNTVSDKADIATVKSFTRTQIEDLKKNDDVAIDWDKALEPVEE